MSVNLNVKVPPTNCESQLSAGCQRIFPSLPARPLHELQRSVSRGRRADMGEQRFVVQDSTLLHRFHMELPTIDQAIEALYNLNVGVIGQGADRHERPHKPVLLLAVLDLVAVGDATPHRIGWSQQLRQRFSDYFVIVRDRNDQCTPENPFFYLRQEGWWQPLREGNAGQQPLDTTPTVGDATANNVFARLTGGMDLFMVRPEDRLQLRRALISRFFPQARARLVELFAEGTSAAIQPQPTAKVEESEGSEYGRSSGFRRKVLEVYDFQCAACGLRIKLPQVSDLTFVDAAHIVPFSVTADDHPRNGIALCKNHHWAMDRFLIAPSPEGTWRVSPLLDGRRSAGEEALVYLTDKRILLPSEEAFHPRKEDLEWRSARLIA